MNLEDVSLVEWFGSDGGHKCGYCKSSNSNISHGMWAHRLSCSDYQDLIDRGWRRSGKYIYKSLMNKTCCPMYTINCRASEFQISKSQKKVIKRVNKYLQFDIKPKKFENYIGEMEGVREIINNFQSEDVLGNNDTRLQNSSSNNNIDQNIAKELQNDEIQCDQSDAKELIECKMKYIDASQSDNVKEIKINNDQSELKSNLNLNDGITNFGKIRKEPQKGTGLDPTKPHPKKAKLLRLERKLLKSNKLLNYDIKTAGTSLPAATDFSAINIKSTKNKSMTKFLEDYLFPVVENPKHTLEVRLVRSCPRGREFNDTYISGFNVYKKYQVVVHRDEKDEVTLKQYTRFLVDSPLIAKGNMGSYHHQYFLDGILIAIGVVDILPNCISSVYLFYDPEFEFLSLGTYSALREIALTRSLNISNYYMGFYIHTCPKMRYKGQFSPSFLLCPKAYTWHKLVDCVPKLETQKYSTFSQDGDIKGETDDDDVTVRDIAVLHRGEKTNYYNLMKRKDRKIKDGPDVRLYATLVGTKLAERILLYRDA